MPNGRIKVTHPRAGVCTHISVMGDESVSATRGIIVGASGGGASTELELYDTRLGRNLDLTSDSDYARVASAWSNIWFAVWQVVEDTPTS